MHEDSAKPEISAEQTDGSAPSFPVVGIGASSGGLAALQAFFRATPADSGMSFVVILHLSPTYESNAAELIQRVSSIPVVQVNEPVAVAPNHVYVIPPGFDLSMEDSRLLLVARGAEETRHAPIDRFFRALAGACGSNAAAVVLSGSGADGSSGVQRVKEAGGVVAVQDLEEAEFDMMPRSALATGIVDFALPAAEIPPRLITFWRNAEQVRLPPPDQARGIEDSEALREIFVLLRTRTGHDFSQYKRATLLRRLGRRMQVNSVETLAAYLEVLRSRPDEVQALLRDLLISVTNFFRDGSVWQSLELAVPTIFAGKRAGDQVRVWVAGCATGEEAYSVAMLLQEYALTLEQPPSIQIFATDIDEDAINVARQGVYPETIAADVLSERLQRFMTKEQGQYRVKKEIRDLVLFAPHNLLRDPPFSRLDLITCRNVLIYLNRDVQEQVLQLFHFVLWPEGFLLLGASESTDGVPGLFTPIDKAQRLFQRRTVPVIAPAQLPVLPLSGPLRRSQRPSRGPAEPGQSSFGDLHAQLLAAYIPPSVIVSEDLEIVHLSRGAGRFLEFTEGEPSHNLLKVVHPDLRLELRTAIFAAGQRGMGSETRRVRVDLDGAARLMELIVEPIREPEWARGSVLVVFNDLADAGDLERVGASDTEPIVRRLEDELQRTRDQLRTTIEQYETAVEEYKAANEELQAVNEELRAATEELETSKEELQSVNEELTTLNQELKHKVEEVSQTNNDLQNLMTSTEIGTIFVDRELRIKRYTASAKALFNLIPSDINRPLGHVTHKLEYDQIGADAARVLETLARIEREVRSGEGRWYLARLLPYRTLEDKIDGVILTFVDITERRQAEEVLRRAHAELEAKVAERTAELAQSNAQLRDEAIERERADRERREALNQLITAQEDERRRISRELHDQLGQQISLLRLELERLGDQKQIPAAALERLGQSVAMLDNDIDRLALELRPSALDDLGLEVAVRQYVDTWRARSQVDTAFEMSGSLPHHLPAEIEIVLYRVVQEALNNILKHAEATHVSVVLEHRPDQVAVIVEDDGRGFDQDAIGQTPVLERRLGLLGIHERVSMVGGTVTIETEPGHGTTLFIRVPLDASRPGDSA